jgi:hypothetical protein
MFSTVLAESVATPPGPRLDGAGEQAPLAREGQPGRKPGQRAATANAVIVSGMRRPIPSSSLTRSIPVVT